MNAEKIQELLWKCEPDDWAKYGAVVDAMKGLAELFRAAANNLSEGDVDLTDDVSDLFGHHVCALLSILAERLEATVSMETEHFQALGLALKLAGREAA